MIISHLTKNASPSQSRKVPTYSRNEEEKSVMMKRTAVMRVMMTSIYTYLQNKRMRRCGVPPPHQ